MSQAFIDMKIAADFERHMDALDTNVLYAWGYE